MNADIIMNAIGNVDDRYIAEAMEYKAKKKPVWLMRVAIAACLCIALLGTAFLLTPEKMMSFAEALEYYEAKEYKAGEPNNISRIYIEDIQCIYERVWRVENIDYFQQKVLPQYVGKQFMVTDKGVWYIPKDVDNLYYLIFVSNTGDHSLYNFYFFLSFDQFYTIGESLTMIAGIKSVDDIESIVVLPHQAGYNNDEQIYIKEHIIGTRTYKDKETISKVYNCLCKQSYISYSGGGAYWKKDMAEKYQYSYSFGGGSSEIVGKNEYLYGIRYLEIHLKNGTKIKWLYYSAFSGKFVISGLQYHTTLPFEDIQMLNEIFGIA